MLTGDEYLLRATELHCRRQVAAEEAAIEMLAAKMRHDDERRETHERLCERHGLVAERTTPRMLARAERAYGDAWRGFVIGSASSGARGLHILDPENAGIEDRATIDALLATRAKMRKQFEASWPPADLASRIRESVTDGVEQLHGHNATRVA
jgi:hypothetical protein